MDIRRPILTKRVSLFCSRSTVLKHEEVLVVRVDSVDEEIGLTVVRFVNV